MRKEDLKVNDIVKTREGKLYMLHKLDGEYVLVGNKTYVPFSSYTHNLLHEETGEMFRCLDIVEVRRPFCRTELIPRYWRIAPLVWMRLKLSSLAEMLGYEVEIIDED